MDEIIKLVECYLLIVVHEICMEYQELCQLNNEYINFPYLLESPFYYDQHPVHQKMN